MDEQPRLSTFWFSDVEGSTRLLGEVGDAAFRELLRAHRATVRTAFAEHGGTEIGTEGDSFFATFPSPIAAADAAAAVQTALDGGAIRVRIGIHTGVAYVGEDGYVGMDVHRAARIASVAHGGQVVLSATARAHVAAPVTDLGEHRLKDLSAPVHLFQLGDAAFPALRSLYRTNLPVPSTPFLGRESERAAVAALLEREDVRLVTLTGPGGMGKTRLALQAAADAADRFSDGVWWIPLSPLRDPALVLATIAQTLQIVGGGGESIASALAERLRGRQILIVIDNAEHLLPDVAGAIAQVAAIAGPKLCVTSRERLALPGEQVFGVPEMSERDAVQLFLARARQLDQGFGEPPGLAALCAQLDNLPLAIELAAARTPLFSVAELAARLGRSLDLLKAGRGREERHRTLLAAIDWSYDLLSAEEQRIYRALALFRGGCTLDALEQVAGAEPDTVASLLDKSLVRRRDGDGGPRVFMLEMVRRHAEARLAEDLDRAALAAASARYYTDLTEQAFAHVTSFEPGNERSWGSMRDERDNVRASLALHLAAGDTESLARLCAGEWPLWYFEGDAFEGAQWLECALTLRPPRQLRSPIENAYSALLLVSGDAHPARALAEAAVVHARETGDRRAEAAALITLGNDRMTEADGTPAGVAAWRDAVAAARVAGAPWWEACALANIVEWSLAAGRIEEAAGACAELTRLEGGTRNVIISVEVFRAEIAWIQGDRTFARECLVSALRRQRATLFASAYDELVLTSRIVADEGRVAEAAALSSAASARRDDLGFSVPDAWNVRSHALTIRLADELGPDAFEAAAARGRGLSLDDTIDLAIELLER